jgi:3-oxoacyl-(acyl-carrier-protein) synthase
MDGLGRLAVAAAKAALEDASLAVAEDDADGVGLAFGTGYGCLASNFEYLEGIHARGTRLGNPVIFQNTVPNAATGYVAMATGIRGPNATFAAGRVAAAEALAFGREQIQEGWAFAALCGSADQLSTPARWVLGAHDPESASGQARPFDRRRDGIVPREGACFVVLEDLPRAERRGAAVQAEVIGMGQSGGPAGGPPPLAAAIRDALDDAGIGPESVDLVVSSANGSRAGDRREAEAVLKALPHPVPVTCPPARLGETLGATAAFGLAAACLVFALDRLPALDPAFVPDPDCPLLLHGGEPRALRPEIVLLPVAGDDGTAHALVLRRYRS